MFKGWQDRRSEETELEQLLNHVGCNLGIKTGNNLIVLDIDSTQLEKIDFILKNVGDTPMKMRSPSGGLHLYFRTRAEVQYGNGVRQRGEPYDLRWNGCFIVSPQSKSAEGVAYEWIGEMLPVAELPIIKIRPLRERKRIKTKARKSDAKQVVSNTVSGVRDILYPEAYCMKILSIQGQNGSAALVRVVCILRDAGRSPQQTLDFLRQKWNPVCAARRSLRVVARDFSLLCPVVRLRFLLLPTTSPWQNRKEPPG